MGEHAFAYCSSLQEITIPAGISDIGWGTFSGCESLGSNGNVNIPNTVKRLGKYAFYGCRRLTSVTIPSSVTRIDDQAFSGCRGLTNVIIKGDAPQVGARFYENTNPGLVTYVRRGSKGWNGPGSTDLPEKWPVGDPNARPIRYMDDKGGRAAVASAGDTSNWQKGPTDAWFVEWDKALAEAKKTGKKIFALNTGSDWCGWCKRLRADVLDKDAFTKFARENLVLLYLDSPSRTPHGKEQKAHNKQIVKALGFGGGVPSSLVFSADGVKLGGIGGGGQKVEAYIDQIKNILAEKGESFRSDDAKILFSEGYAKLADRIAEERARLPPVAKDDFKAQLTGVAVCSGANSNYDNLDFKPPTTHLEVEPDEKAVFRIEHDFPQGYAAAVWARGKGSFYSNPSGRYPGKGVKYGYLGLYNAKEDIQLSSVEIRTNSEPELDDSPHGWTIGSTNVDLVFFAKPSGKPNLAIAAPAEKVAEANGYHWFYKLEKGGAVLCANGNRPCLEPTPQGKVVVPKELDGRMVSVLDRRAFADCDQMTEIVLPEGLKEIRGERTFVDCRRLKEVQFPATLRLMGFHTFQGCVNLRRINLANCIGVPAGKEEHSGAVGGCFLHCPNLEAVDVFASNPAFVAVDGALYSRSRKELLVYPKTRTNVTLPGGVSAIGSSAFASCRGLRTIRLPKRVQTIRPWAFESCDNLEELILPGSVKRIGQKFLVKDTSLRRVVFLGDAPAVEAPLLAAVPEALVVEVARGSKGWNGPGSADLPERWPAGAGNDSRPIRYLDR